MANIMASRVFRNTIFGRFREAEISTSLISRELRVDIPLPIWERELGSKTKQDDDSLDTGGTNLYINDTQKDELRNCATP